MFWARMWTKDLFKDSNPLDKTISIRGAKFKVIGVLKEKGSTFGSSQDFRVLISIQIARSLFSAPNINYDLSIMIANKDLMDQAVDNATITMRRVRKLNPVEENNFGIERSDELINTLLSNTEVLGISAWVIGIITVFGSSIALMNIMLGFRYESVRVKLGFVNRLARNVALLRGSFSPKHL